MCRLSTSSSSWRSPASDSCGAERSRLGSSAMPKPRSRGKAARNIRRCCEKLMMRHGTPVRRQSGTGRGGAKWITHEEAVEDRKSVIRRTVARTISKTLQEAAAVKVAALAKAAASAQLKDERAAYRRCGISFCENKRDFLPCTDCKKGLCNECGLKMISFRNHRCPFCGRHSSVRPGTLRPDFKS